MKKLLLFCYSLFGVLPALPLGNPADPALYTTGLFCGDPCNLFSWKEVGMVRLGFYGDYVMNAHMRVDSNTRIAKNIHDTRVITNAAMLVFNAFQQMEVFGTLGATNLTFVGNGGSFSTDTKLLTVECSPTLSWSIGGKGILWRYRHLTLGAEAQYQFFRPRINRLIRQADGLVHYPNSGNRFHSQWWQAGVAIACTAGTPSFQLIPYCGMKFAGSKFSLNNYVEVFPGVGTSYTFTALVAAKLYGYGVGMTALVRQKVSLNVEGQFGNERAMSINGQINF